MSVLASERGGENAERQAQQCALHDQGDEPDDDEQDQDSAMTPARRGGARRIACRD